LLPPFQLRTAGSLVAYLKSARLACDRPFILKLVIPSRKLEVI